MTLLPARSLEIHCTRKRAANTSCAASPSTSQKWNLVTKTSWKYALSARRTESASINLRRLRHAPAPADEPPHAEQIQDSDPQPVPQAVVGLAVPARAVDHVDVADLQAFPPDQGGQETVQAVEIRQVEEQVAAKSFQAAAGVARAVAQDSGAHAIGDARLELLERRRLPAHPLAGDEPDARGAVEQGAQQGRQEGRIVLAVA